MSWLCTNPSKASSIYLLQRPQSPRGSIALLQAAFTSRAGQGIFFLRLFPLPHHSSPTPGGSLTHFLQIFAQSPSQVGLLRPLSLKMLTSPNMTFLIPLTQLYFPLSIHYLVAYHIIHIFVMLIVCLPLLECMLHKGRNCFIYCISWAQNRAWHTVDVE